MIHYENNNNSVLKILLRFMAFLIGIAVNYDIFTIGGISWVSLIILTYIVLILRYTNFVYVVKKYIKLLTPLLCFLALLSIVNWLNTNDLNNSILPVSLLFCVVIFYSVLAHVDKDNNVKKYYLCGIMVGGLIMVFYFSQGIGLEYEGGRLSMFGMNSNNLGCLLCLTVALIIHEGVYKDLFHLKLFRFVLILLVFPVIQMVFLTSSRTAFLALSLMLSTFVLLIPTKNILLKSVFLFFFTIIVSFGYKYASEFEELIDRLTNAIELRDSSGREDRWDELLIVAFQNPAGIGQTGYTRVSQTLYGSKDIEGSGSPHNVILEVLLYTGYIGLSLMLYFWYRIIRIAIRIYKVEHDILPFLFMSVFAIQLFFGQLLIFRIVWISLAIFSVRRANPKLLPLINH